MKRGEDGKKKKKYEQGEENNSRNRKKEKGRWKEEKYKASKKLEKVQLYNKSTEED